MNGLMYSALCPPGVQRGKYGKDAKSVRAPNTLPKRRRLVRPFKLMDGQVPRVPRREVAPLHHIALARKPSLDASGLLLWARATS